MMRKLQIFVTPDSHLGMMLLTFLFADLKFRKSYIIVRVYCNYVVVLTGDQIFCCLKHYFSAWLFG